MVYRSHHRAHRIFSLLSSEEPAKHRLADFTTRNLAHYHSGRSKQRQSYELRLVTNSRDALGYQFDLWRLTVHGPRLRIQLHLRWAAPFDGCHSLHGFLPLL